MKPLTLRGLRHFRHLHVEEPIKSRVITGCAVVSATLVGLLGLYRVSGKDAPARNTGEAKSAEKTAMNTATSKPVIACTLDPADLGQRRQVLGKLTAKATSHRELDHGYSFRFTGDSVTLAELAEAIEPERRCCSFFRFVVTVEPENGPISLELIGPEGTKDFLRGLLPMQ